MVSDRRRLLVAAVLLACVPALGTGGQELRLVTSLGQHAERPVSAHAPERLIAPTPTFDSWPGPKVVAVFSDDGSRFVRVLPGSSVGDAVGFGGSPKGPYARAEFYERQTDRSYRLTADVALLNPVAPVDLLLSNEGYLFTLDNWHNLGYGKAVAIYDPAGRAAGSWELERLYNAANVGRIPVSISSRWWRCAPFHYVDGAQTQVYVREALGGYFVFDLHTATFVYHGGSLKCEPASLPLSATFFAQPSAPPPAARKPPPRKTPSRSIR